MKQIEDIRNVYLLGIGGIGMSALARYFKHHGADVSGYDKTPSPLTDELISEGIPVHFDDDPSKVPTETDLAVLTPAVPKSLKELHHIRDRQIPLKKRSEVLAAIAERYQSIAVAGTHGKTTTTSIIAHILNTVKGDTSAFVGGIMANYNSNVVLNDQAKRMVLEADEYDRSFLHLSPSIAVVTSTDPDHLDVYGTPAEMEHNYQLFTERIRPDGTLVHKKGLHLQPKQGVATLSYSAREQADFWISKLQIVNGSYVFDVQGPEKCYPEMQLNIGGRHNVENAMAAIAVCDTLGMDGTDIREALAGYRGVKRRFEYHIKETDLVFIDDYAHHPREIESLLLSVKELYPDRKVTAIFQPHLYSRTRDLEDGFAASLALADELVLLDIYPAREEPIPGVSSAHLLNKVALKTKQLVEKSNLVNAVISLVPEIVVTIGAGDIDREVVPLCKALMDWRNG